MIEYAIFLRFISFLSYYHGAKCDNGLITPQSYHETSFSIPDLLLCQHFLASAYRFLNQLYFVSRIGLFSKAVLMVALMESSLRPRLLCSADINIHFCETVQATLKEQKHYTTCVEMVVTFRPTNTRIHSK